MTAVFRQFVVFGTNNAGLERLLRFFQAVFLVLRSYPALIILLLPASPPGHIAAVTASLFQLQSRVNITRRLLRLFRFLDTFQSGWNLYLSDSKSLEVWLDVLGSSCLGMFGMLESVTLLDLLHIDYLEIFGVEQTISINYQAQFFWLLGLYTSILSSGIRLLRVFAYRGVPNAGAGFATGEKLTEEVDEMDATKDKATQADKKSPVEDETEENKGGPGPDEARLRQKSERSDEVKESSNKAWNLGLKLLSDVLDLVLPATAVGWIEVDAGLVGIAMVCSTIITAGQVWTRCGQEMQRQKGK